MKFTLIALFLVSGAALAAENPHAGHIMPAKPAVDPHAAHDMTAKPSAPAVEPAAPVEFAADRIFGAEVMAAARSQSRHEHGAHVFSKVMVNALEFVPQRGPDGYAWDAEAWIGGDINRAVLKTEGEGSGGVHDAEVQALYSRAIGPYFDLQAGLRHDLEPSPSRTYAVLAVEGLAPYWFDVEAAAFLSDKGDILGRVGATYDQLITQRLVIQPHAEINFSAQEIPTRGIGAGLSEIEVGARLRYEIRREFAPYVGLSYGRKIGASADFARAAGERAGETRFLIGARTWF
jgi:copper resistance protein B